MQVAAFWWEWVCVELCRDNVFPSPGVVSGNVFQLVKALFAQRIECTRSGVKNLGEVVYLLTSGSYDFRNHFLYTWNV